MAAPRPVRLRRDYTSDDADSYTTDSSSRVNQRSSLSPTKISEPMGSPRTVVSSKHLDDEQLSNPTTDDNDSFHLYDGEEPVLHESQVDPSPADSATALSARSITDTRDVKPSKAPIPSSRASPTALRNGYSSPPPPPKSILKQPISDGYEQRDERPQAQFVPGGAQSDHSDTANKMPEFFSQQVFQVVLHNPAIAHLLLRFGQSRLCGETMEFLARVNKYYALLHEVSKAVSEIHRGFIAPGAPAQVADLSPEAVAQVNREIKSSLASALPKLESTFGSAQTDVERLVFTDLYPKFVRHQMSVSAAKALGADRAKYTGLGDCFVLTDPCKADNPIVFSSDGFAKVTGYRRNEIIPRNCRFLQSHLTDRAAVTRIKTAVSRREECVELLLNQRKDGEPFWNLLYVTPLFDGNGNLVFFLGGQINCSTTIHSTSDVLRILAQSNEEDEDDSSSLRSSQPQPKPSRSIRNPFRASTAQVQQRLPGQENGLVNKLSNMPLKTQFREFYNAYSHYLVINYSSYLITFVSGGIVDMLFPIKAKSAVAALAVGTDVFKFLSNHGQSSVSWDFKSAVKGALKSGNAVSVELKLCARQQMGFEKFLLHWTPLKDGTGAVQWVVLTLGSQRRD